MPSRVITGTLLKHSGEAWANARLDFTLITDTATRVGEALPVWSRTIYTGSDGAIPAGVSLEVPDTDAWRYRLKIESNKTLEFYLTDGGAITIDNIVALAGVAGNEAGTPQGDLLLDIYDGAQTATDGQVLTADGLGGADWEDVAGSAWLAAASARVADGDDVATRAGDGDAGELMISDANGNAVRSGIVPGTAAGADTGDFDAAGSAAAVASDLADLSGVTVEPAAASLGKIGLTGMPLAPVRKATIITSNVIIMDYIGERLYGFGNPTPGLLVYSDDYGETWATLQNTGTGDTLRGIRERTDGEVLVWGNGGVWVSAGWATNPATATWTKTLSPSAGANFLRWSVDVYQDRVIVSEYAVSPRDPARYLWISEDGGDTFSEALDLDALFPGNPGGYHWHGVCIDPYVSGGRFWAWAGDDTQGAYWSDDGTTWTNITSTVGNITTLTPTENGLVLGTDSNQPQGLFRIVRTHNPADMVIETMYDVRSIQNTFGFSLAAMANPRTGHAYVTIKSDFANTPGYILASPNGLFGQEIYAIDGAAAIQNLAVNAAGTKVSVSYAQSSTQYILIFDAPGFGVNLEQYDRGGIGGGVAGSGGIAVGRQSAALGFGVAIGPSANAVSRAVAIGRGVVAPDLCTVIGSGASVSATWNNYNVIVGEGAQGAEQTVVVGARAQASATGGALGYLAKSTHAGSWAIGNNTNTQAANQVAVGARDVEIQSATRGLILRDTNGVRYRITVDTDGSLVVTSL